MIDSTPRTVPTVKLLIGGEFLESRTTQWRDVVNPPSFVNEQCQDACKPAALRVRVDVG